MIDASEGQEWTAPGATSPPSVGQVPDAPFTNASAAPAAPIAFPVAAPAAPIAVPAVAPQQAAPTFRSWQPGLIPLRPVSFGEFLSVPFKAIRYNRAVVVGGPLLFVGGAMLLLAASLWLAFTDPSLALQSPTSQFQGIEASTIIVGVVALLAIVLAEALSSAVVAPGIARGALGEKISLGTALKAIGPRTWPLFVLWLVSSFALGIAFVPGLILLGIGVNDSSDGLVGLGVLAMVALGFVVGVPVYIISAVARCVIVLEQKGVFASIRRTMKVIRGRFWWSVLIIGVTATLVGIATGILQQLLSFVASIGILIGFSGEWVGTLVFIVALVLGAVISYVITYAYMGSVYALIYIDARIRHEAFDVDLAQAAEARRG